MLVASRSRSSASLPLSAQFILRFIRLRAILGALCQRAGELHGGVGELIVGNDAVDEAEGQRLFGVYRARVALRDPATGGWIDKKAPSTFFPDAMSDHEVVAAVLGAFRDGRRRGDGQFVGGSGRGFAIEGWFQSGRINSAYPLRGP
jgi:hypothetical protein